MNGMDTFLVFPAMLITLVFLNRYIVGSLLRWHSPISKPSIPKKFNDDSPEVTVIIPLYNEGKSIFDTLVALSAQDYPHKRLSIVVVDDCSTDDSHEWAERAAQLDPRITVHRNVRNVGKRIGIARAVAGTKSEFIVSGDSDVYVYPDAIRLLITNFESEKMAAVGGCVYIGNPHVNWLTKMQAIKYFFGYQFLKNIESNFDQVLCLSGCLTAYRREVLIELEPILMNRNLFGIPIKYGEDRFLTRQIVKAGYQTKLSPNAVCTTKAMTTLKSYFAQQLRWRRSNVVDFLGGLTHAFGYNPVVGIHYMTLNVLLILYPFILWYQAFMGELWSSLPLHLGVLGIFAVVYEVASRRLPRNLRVHPVHFLWMAVIMPVTYMVLSILAMFTLDSGSWETRNHHIAKSS